jgi:hypothetical protein
MSRECKSAILEREAAIRETLRLENEATQKAEADRVESERKKAEDLRLEALRREASSCRCGVDHVSGERLTQPRQRQTPSGPADLGQMSSSVFIGNLPYEMEETVIRAALANLIGDDAVQRFRLAKEAAAPLPTTHDPMEDDDFFWSSYHHRPNYRPKLHKGLGFLTRRNPSEARATIEALDGHELITPSGRRFAIRVNFARPHTRPTQE